MPKEMTIRCPYYVTRSRPEKTYATITCFPLGDGTIFGARNKLEFRGHTEQRQFAEAYCARNYEQCPYYRALYKTTEEKEIDRWQRKR